MTSINDQRIRKVAALEIMGSLLPGIMCMPEHRLLVHMLVRAYLDYYLLKEGTYYKENPKHSRKTKALNQYKFASIKVQLKKIEYWIYSDKIYPFSFLWICQNLEEGDGTGIASQFRQALSLERGARMKGGHMKKYSEKEIF